MKKWSFVILLVFMAFMIGGGPFLFRQATPASTSRISPIEAVTNPGVQPSPAQTEDAEIPTVAPMKPHAVSISPYEIKRLIDKNNLAARRKQTYELDMKPIGKQLSFEQTDTSGLFMDVCNGDCEAEIFNFELDGKPGRETILRLRPTTTGLYNHLVFKQSKSQNSSSLEWILLGDIDTKGWWASKVPQYSVVTAGAERWLTINSPFNRNSGFETEVERFYEVTPERGVVEVLAYQSRIYDAAFEHWLGIRRSTKLLKTEVKDGAAVIILQSSSFYEANLGHNQPFPFLTTRRRITFKKERGARAFVFDPLNSELSSKELDPEFGEVGAVTDAEFLKYNYRELAWIAARGNAKQRKWLRNHLQGRDESPEKQSLQKALEMSSHD
jgi:hypothetical protein